MAFNFAVGTLGKKWGPECWKDAGWRPCTDHSSCNTLHLRQHGLNISVRGECPAHNPSRDDGSQKIRITESNLERNFLENKMPCGCYPAGVTGVWAAMHENGLLLLDIDVQCANAECNTRDTSLMVLNKTGSLLVKEALSEKCCDRPRLHFTNCSARWVTGQDVFRVKLEHLFFSQDTVRDTFRDGRRLQTTVDDLTAGRVRASQIEIMEVIVHKNRLFALGNRRLAAFQAALQFFRQNRRAAPCFDGENGDEILVRLSAKQPEQEWCSALQPNWLSKGKFTTKNRGEGVVVLHEAPVARCGRPGCLQEFCSCAA